MSSGLDGLLKKRPGTQQWGQTLKKPSGELPQSYQDFTSEENFLLVEGSGYGTTIKEVLSGGIYQISCLAAANTVTTERAYRPSGNLPSEDDASLRMTIRGANLDEYNGSDTAAETFAFRLHGASGGIEFALYGPDTSDENAGLYYRQASDNTYAFVTGTTQVGYGKWTTLEIRMDWSGDVTIYMDEVLVATIARSLMNEQTPQYVDSYYEFEARCSDANYTIRITDVMYNNTAADPFEAAVCTNVTTFNALVSGQSLQRTVIVSAGDYVYQDAGQLGVWRPLLRLSYKQVFSTGFRKEILLIDSDGVSRSKSFLWDGNPSNALTPLDEAPGIQFATEHQTRIWAAGDRTNPLRVYYSGDRQPNVWFAPDQNNISNRYHTQLNAGYVEVPSKDGDEVTAVFGDYYGQLIIFTRQGVFRCTGSGVNSFAIAAINQEIGCESPHGVAQVGNDLWFVSREGVHSIQATEKFGDLIKGMVSGPIQDLWGGDESTVRRINQNALSEARIAYLPTVGLVLVALPMASDRVAEDIYVFNTTTEEWLGPWSVQARGLKRGELQSPVYETVLTGNDSGQVLYFATASRVDAGTGYTSTLESAFLNGRSIDPLLVGLMKTWKRIRIYIMPRGDWDVKVFTRTEDSVYWEDNPLDPNQYKSQNVFAGYTLDEDFRLDEDPDGRLAGRESLGYIEVRPDIRGYSFAFKLVQAGTGEDLAIQGVEVDFVYASHERE